MTTIQVRLPDDLAGQVSRLTNNAEAYIVDLLRSQVQDVSLAEEYRLANDESKELVRAFANVDLEGWENEY